MSFKKPASLRPAALLKGDSSTGVFSRILRDFLEHLFVFDYRMLSKNGVLKNPTKFRAKFMWTTAFGISENRPCMAGWKFIDVLQNWCKSVFKVLSFSTEMQSSTDFVLRKVDNSTQIIMEVDLNIQAAARGNPGT